MTSTFNMTIKSLTPRHVFDQQPLDTVHEAGPTAMNNDTGTTQTDSGQMGDNQDEKFRAAASEHTLDTQDRLNAIMALETSIIYLVTVALQTLAVHYVLGSVNGYQYHMQVQSDILRILGSMWVDITALYFIVLGYILHERVEEDSSATDTTLIDTEIRCRRHMDVIRHSIPDIILSTIPYAFMQIFSGFSNTWTAVYTALSPTLLSTFFDFRESNSFRTINESIWIAHLTIIYTLLAYFIHKYTRSACDSLHSDINWRLLQCNCVMAWLMGFLHLYAAYMHPAVANAVTRSVFTNAIFVITGMFIAAIYKHEALRARVTLMLQSSRNIQVYNNGWMFCGIGVFIVAFYLHHTQNTTEREQCTSVFGGTPCLWNVDICNVRMYPVYGFFFLWYADDNTLFENNLFGPIRNPLTKTFTHISQGIVRMREYNLTFILYSEIIALGISNLLMHIFPKLAINYAIITVTFEVVFVTAVCVLIKTYVTPMAIHAFDAVLQYTRIGDAATKVIQKIPI